MNILFQELKIAFESLRHRPGFVTTVILTLGITLGALITFFNLNHVLLVKPLPYPQQEQLFITQHVTSGNQGETTIGSPFVPGLLHTYKQQQSFDEMTILSTGSEFLMSHPQQPRIDITYTTPEYFQLLAAPMALGRTFNRDEGLNQNNAVAVISYQTWQTLFNGRDDIIGHKFQLRSHSFSIVGVSAQNFIEPEITQQKSAMWLPWDFNGMNEILLRSWNNGQGNIAGLGRLKSGLTPTQAESTLSTSLNQAYQQALMSQADRSVMSPHMAIHLQPLKTRLLGDSGTRSLLLLGAVFALLVIASANVINLFYSRAAEKQRTFAIQAALGARKRHLFNAMFVESAVLTFSAGAFGLLIAAWGIDLLKTLGNAQFSRLDELGLDVITVIFTLLMSVILAVVFAVLSSRIVNYDALREQLQSSGKGAGLQISSRARNVLVISQITLASLLLAGASVVLGQAFSVIQKPLGYDVEPLHRVSLDFRAGLIPPEQVASRNQLLTEINNKLMQLPQVKGIAPSFNTAIGFNMAMSLIDTDNQKRGEFPANFVAANYFEVMGLSLVEGRMFSEDEVRNGSQVVVLSRSAATQAGRGESAIGLRVKVGGGEFKTVIGVVEDVYDPTRTSDYQFRDSYLPHAPWNMHFILRLQDNAELSKDQLINQLQSIDRSIRVARYSAFADRHARVVLQDKITATVAAGLSILALALAGTGIYGVLSYSSQMRRYELGIRMALGAKSRHIVKLVIKDNMTPIAAGLLISAITALIFFAFGRQHVPAFAEVSLLPLLAILPIILLTAFTASYIPVRSVIRQDPIKALRNE